MSYLVTTGQGRSEGLFDDVYEAAKHAKVVGGDLWVSYDLYLQEIYPDYKMALWLKYWWSKLRKRCLALRRA